MIFDRNYGGVKYGERTHPSVTPQERRMAWKWAREFVASRQGKLLGLYIGENAAFIQWRDVDGRKHLYRE